MGVKYTATADDHRDDIINIYATYVDMIDITDDSNIGVMNINDIITMIICCCYTLYCHRHTATLVQTRH